MTGSGAGARRTPFAALLSAYVVSMLGTSMSELAVPWLVLTTTGSAGKTGLVAFAQMLPYVTMQALAGPVVDRVGLRRSYVWGNLTAAVAVGAVPLMYATGGLSLGVLIGLVAVAGAVRGAADCANMALVPATARAGQIPLERAAGLNASANRTAILLGAPLAGVLVTVTNSATVVLVDAITFAVAAIVVAIGVRGIDADVTPAPDVDKPIAAPDAPGVLRRYGRDLADGLRFLGRDRLLLGIVAMVAVTNLLDQGLSAVLLPVWVREQLHSAAALGIRGGAMGLGSVVGNLAGAWLGPRVSRRGLYSVGYLVGGAPRFFILAIASTLWPVLAVSFVADIFGGSLNSVIGATSYERIPPHMQARVLGVIRASAWIGIPFGALLAGLVADATNVRLAIAISGAAYLLTTLAPFVFPTWRQMRRPDPADAETEHIARAAT
ncbi:MAG TPA: MFS transporter [Micromonosporaceae bacterium]|nr:MFS transporter [Micromonosporaceae bacterium]